MKRTDQDRGALEKALKLRNRIKKAKPKFVRQESWRYKRLNENWRKPKGLDNKMRRKIKGWPATVNTGYRGPKGARGLHPSGYREVLVHNIEEIGKINPKTQAIRIAHEVGKRKKTKILLESRKRKIKILNFKEVEEATREEKETVKEDKIKEDKEVAEKEEPKRTQKKLRKNGRGQKKRDEP